ncbi:NAD-dependent epimerase/dehydratase family protein [Dysgonomonas sp. 216]|uniref:NAD(P)-dependent oxidoreductase n=1 Tax=Dysgonomonas sp. 216 TaxID=2302934 RepID=UPI0013D7E574|nr:NAD(P)H-binding protein [Dysgonomonas sp. 216]NDW17961.1 NAD-dependent epimerase/dehydratase family protein [Dysgonomonas sp. 216]
MKKIVLIGATGFVGSHILNELVSRNYEVIAIARNSEQIKNQSANVKTVSVDVNNTQALSAVMKDNDVVISAFNAGWSNPDLYNDYMKGAHSIEKAAENARVKRLIVIGGAGSLYIGGQQIVDGDDFPEQFKAGATAARDYLNDIRKNKTLDWTYFSPAIEMNAAVKTGRTGVYRVANDEPVFDKKGHSRLSVEDLAVAIVDELEHNRFSHMRFTAGY